MCAVLPVFCLFTAEPTFQDLPGRAVVLSAWSLECCASCELNFIDSCQQCENFGILLTGLGKLVVLKDTLKSRIILLSICVFCGSSAVQKETKCSF